MNSLMPQGMLIGGAIMWGLGWLPLQFFAARGLAGMPLVLLTYSLLSLLALPVLWQQRRQWASQYRQVLTMGLCGGWATAALVTALAEGNVVRVMLLFYLAPVWAMVGGWLLLGERLSGTRLFALGLAMLGIGLTLGVTSEALTAPGANDWLALSAGLAFSLNNLATRAADRVPLASKALVSFVGSALLGGLFCLLLRQPLPPLDLTLSWQIALLALGWLVSMARRAVRPDSSGSRPRRGAGGVRADRRGAVVRLVRQPRHRPERMARRRPDHHRRADRRLAGTSPFNRDKEHLRMTVHMDQLSWVDYERRVREGAVVFLPCGATEQHGPHLPLGTDALLASAISADVAARVGGLVAPALSYGYKSQPKCGGGQHFCGTTSLDGATLSALVRDAVREFHRHGVRRLVLLLGHYENQWFVAEGIQLALRDLGPDAGLEVMRLEHWDFCHEQTLTDIFPEGFPGFALEHAAVIETSLMLHFHPQLVALEKIPDDAPADFPPYDMYPTRTEWVPPSGVLSSARGSSAAKGQRLAHDIVEGIAAAVCKEFAL